MSNNDTINGYPVIATFNFKPQALTRGGRVIIVDRGASYDSGRYVATTQFATNGTLDSEWASGDYCSTLFDALGAFIEKVNRNARLELRAAA